MPLLWHRSSCHPGPPLYLGLLNFLLVFKLILSITWICFYEQLTVVLLSVFSPQNERALGVTAVGC